jgi:chemotaxis protein histidine kinase CheA
MSDSATPAEDSYFTVDSLLKYMGGDHKALAIVGKIVRDALPSGMIAIEVAGTAVREGRYADAGHAFHGLRGSIGTLGTKRFVSAALAIEQAMAAIGQQDNAQDSQQARQHIAVLLDRVENEFHQALAHARAWLAANDLQPPAQA